jgi:hypothetical protein
MGQFLFAELALCFVVPDLAIALRYSGCADFSTVVPSILSATFVFLRYFEARRVGKSRPIAIYRPLLAVAIAVGLSSFYLMQVFPSEAFPLAWIAPFLILEPILYISRLPSLLEQIKRGDWTLTISVMTATLITGFFWEMWNYYSLPKWYYTIPYVDFSLSMSQMPILLS